MKTTLIAIALLFLASLAQAQTCVQADLNHPLTTTLNWVDNSTGETGQVLERKLNSGAYSVLMASLAADLTSYVDSTVQRSTSPNTYTYRLKAIAVVNGQTQESGYSNEACITFAATPPPVNLVAPSGLTTAAVSSSTIRTTWQDIDGETAYELEGKKANAKQWARIASVLADVTTYDWTSRSRYTSYCFRLRALQGTLAGPYSDTACATTSK